MNMKIVCVGLLSATFIFTTSVFATEVLATDVVAKDPNPFAEYEPAMISTAEYPLTVNWQDANKKMLDDATACCALAKHVATEKAAEALLKQVKEAYKTDGKVLIEINAVSQFVMNPKCGKACAARKLWAKALVNAALAAPDTYRKMLFLDQLRWCGSKDETSGLYSLAKCNDKAVAEFARQVISELGGCKHGCCKH